MKIDSALNLVVTLYDDEERVYGYAHSTPIAYEVFEANYQLIVRTYAEIMKAGADLMSVTGPKIASIVLRDVASKMGDGETMSRAFLAEVKRLTSVIIAGETGWEPVPYQIAVDRKMINPEDAREVESVIIFFTVCWHLLPKRMRVSLTTMVPIWGGQTSSLNVTDFIASLRTSSVDGSSGVMAAA